MDFTKMHPFQIIFLAVFGVLAAAGIFLFANYNPETKGGVVGKVTIWGTLPADGMSNGLSALVGKNKEYGNVRYVAKNIQTFDVDLAEAIASGVGPDLIILSQEQLLAHTNKIEVISSKTLPERTYIDSYVPLFELFLTTEGTYGIPVVLDPLVLYYNQPMLETVGVAQAPTTWEAVTGLSTLLTRKTDDQTVTKSLIGIGEYDNVTNARAVVSLLLLQSGTTITVPSQDGTRAALSSSASNFGVSPAESALNFYTQFANPTKTVYSWNRAMRPSRDAFLAGDVALYPGFASELGLLKAGNPNLDFDMAVMPQPQTADRRVTYGQGYAFVVPKASKNRDGAYKAAFTLAGKETAPLFARYLGMAPALRGSLKPQTNDLFAPIFYPEALVAKGWLSPTPSSTDAIFGTMIGNITTGRRSVRDALQTADQSLDAAL